MTQEQQESRLLEKTPDYRKNEMVMMEEFRRRRNLQRYFDLSYEREKTISEKKGNRNKRFDMSDD